MFESHQEYTAWREGSPLVEGGLCRAVLEVGQGAPARRIPRQWRQRIDKPQLRHLIPPTNT